MPDDTTNIPDIQNSTSGSISNIQMLDGSLNSFAQNITTYSESVIKASQMIKGSSDFNTKSTGTVDISTKVVGLENSKKQVEKFKKSVANINVKSFSFDGPKGFISKVTEAARYAQNELGKGASDAQQIMKSGVAVAFQQMQGTLLQKADTASGGIISKYQSDAMAVQKSALQMSVGFGETFDQAQDGTSQFTNAFANMRGNLNASKEDLNKIGSVFKDSMSTSTQIQAFGKLSKVNDALGRGMNATSTAFLVSKATGMDSGTVAEWMGQMYTQLGEDLDGAAESLGTIANAASGSSLSFNKVGTSIMNSANQLKMWGGTVKGVAPMFKAFSNSLKEGQKGLAPELLQKYASALESMDFSKRALMGMQMPNIQNKGAIGAGLEMEAALEGGPEGMSKISDGLMKTLKQFGGGQVITRQQAIENPALEQSFMVQRGILKQMLGTTDAQGTKMLDAFQKMDGSNMEGAKDAQDALADLMKSGKDTQTSTTNAITAQGNRIAKTSLMGAEIILTGLGGLLSKMGGKSAVAQYNKIMDSISGKGSFEKTDLDELVKIFSSEKEDKSKSFSVSKDKPSKKAITQEKIIQKELVTFRKNDDSKAILKIAKGLGIKDKDQIKELALKMEEKFKETRTNGGNLSAAKSQAKEAGLSFIKDYSKKKSTKEIVIKDEKSTKDKTPDIKKESTVESKIITKEVISNEVSKRSIKKIKPISSSIADNTKNTTNVTKPTPDVEKIYTPGTSGHTKSIVNKIINNVRDKPPEDPNIGNVTAEKTEASGITNTSTNIITAPLGGAGDNISKGSKANQLDIVNDSLSTVKNYDIAPPFNTEVSTSRLSDRNTANSNGEIKGNQEVKLNLKVHIDTEIGSNGEIKFKPTASALNLDELNKTITDVVNTILRNN